MLDLQHLLDREVQALSGGELQRFAICATSIQKADIYMYDEPSSYLDVRQRLKAAQAIRSVVDQGDDAQVYCMLPHPYGPSFGGYVCHYDGMLWSPTTCSLHWLVESTLTFSRVTVTWAAGLTKKH